MKKVIIKGDIELSILSVSLKDILEAIRNITIDFWIIDYIYGVGIKGFDMLALEYEVETKKKKLTNNELEELSGFFYQLYDISIVGYINNVAIIGVELIDGSVWEVYTNDERSITSLLSLENSSIGQEGSISE
ncbi:MAG: hypothetical protein BGO09_00205 [Bacteroidetes bacterium 47-18]|nr:MAG: hypothetical protein BGO09_00205 [Bacteroidetes bacterium 47-18]